MRHRHTTVLSSGRRLSSAGRLLRTTQFDEQKVASAQHFKAATSRIRARSRASKEERGNLLGSRWIEFWLQALKCFVFTMLHLWPLKRLATFVFLSAVSHPHCVRVPYRPSTLCVHIVARWPVEISFGLALPAVQQCGHCVRSDKTIASSKLPASFWQTLGKPTASVRLHKAASCGPEMRPKRDGQFERRRRPVWTPVDVWSARLRIA